METIGEKPITVFTPTYNRAELLGRAYQALLRQSCQDFVWLVIDDGSTDDTASVVKQWQREKHEFELRYVYKENGGIHTAYNEAIAHMDTPLCVCVDSDDFLADDAIERILNFWERYGSDEYAGIVGLDCDMAGTVLGDIFPYQKTINLIDLQTGKYAIKNGDRTNVVRTELYKSVAPMKVFDGEKSFNPHYMHLQISKRYDFLVLNEKLKFVEYQPGGMSAQMLLQYKNSPNSFAEMRLLYLSFPNTSFKFKLRHSIHLVSSCILAGDFSAAIKRTPHKAITTLAIPFGWLLSRYIVASVNKHMN